MEKTIKIFKSFSEKGYRAALSHTIEGLDELPLNHPIKIAETALVCEWLRVNHGIWVGLIADNDYTFKFEINTWSWYEPEKCHRLGHRVLGKSMWGTSSKPYDSPQKAYSSAFDYILNNLI
jgi:hypothetical protein